MPSSCPCPSFPCHSWSGSRPCPFVGGDAGAGDTQLLPIKARVFPQRGIAGGADLVRSAVANVPSKQGAAGDYELPRSARALYFFGSGAAGGELKCGCEYKDRHTPPPSPTRLRLRRASSAPEGAPCTRAGARTVRGGFGVLMASPIRRRTARQALAPCPRP